MMAHPFQKPLRAAVALASLGLGGGAHADAIDELKAQIDALTRKVAEIEQRRAVETAKPPAVGAVTAGATPGSFKLPGSDTSVTIGGYVKLDAIYSDPSAGVGSSADQQYEAGAVPVGPDAGNHERGQIKLHARQSRLNLRTSTPTPSGELGTFLEFDLFGAAGNESVSNSHGLRLRHAYGTFGRLLVGQTWTTFSDPAVYPETVDFGGPAGVVFARQPQVRWTQPFAGGQWAVALENPETVVALPGGESFRADDDRIPDLAANARFETHAGFYSIAGLVRQLRVDSATAPSTRAERWGGGVGANALIPLRGGDDIRLSTYLGNAIGRYSIGFFSDGVIGGDGGLLLANQWLAMAAYRHFWRPNLRSTLALSTLRASNPAGTTGSVNKAAGSAHLNLIWSPLPRVNLGLEYLYARREVEDGQDGHLDRLQAAAQLLF